MYLLKAGYMKYRFVFLLFTLFAISSFSQEKMTPELLWKLGRVSALGISKDKKYIVYSVSTPDVDANKSKRRSYIIPVNGGNATEINNADS